MTNLTISVDEELLKKARMRALEENTSVNAVLRNYLETYAGADLNKYIEATKNFLELARKSRTQVGKITWKRDDLYDR